MTLFGRSFAGAWIEITFMIRTFVSSTRRSFAGAWIEILALELKRTGVRSLLRGSVD